ncbi:MAG TPA: hypothetical protein EYP31_02425, partial [Roseibacterium sp.]|nr:hypothetical protein [Roseibacterium sp.]
VADVSAKMIATNAGPLAPVRVAAPKGYILNAQSPTPVAMCHTLGQMMPDLVFGCLSQCRSGRVRFFRCRIPTLTYKSPSVP